LHIVQVFHIPSTIAILLKAPEHSSFRKVCTFIHLLGLKMMLEICLAVSRACLHDKLWQQLLLMVACLLL
jgi:hypothetical protein